MYKGLIERFKKRKAERLLERKNNNRRPPFKRRNPEWNKIEQEKKIAVSQKTTPICLVCNNHIPCKCSVEFKGIQTQITWRKKDDV